MQVIQVELIDEEFNAYRKISLDDTTLAHLEYTGKTIDRPKQLTFDEIMSSEGDLDYDCREVDEQWRNYG